MFGNYREAVNENILTLLSPPHHSQGSCPSHSFLRAITPLEPGSDSQHKTVQSSPSEE